MANNDEQLLEEQNPEQSAELEVLTDGATDLKADESAEKVKRKRSKAEIALNIALWVAIAVLSIAVVLRLFVFNTVAVKGDSMFPTYQDGNVVTVNKTRKPKRGDVVVFYKYDIDSKFKAMFARPEQKEPGQPYELLIKRVIATEGDKVWIQKAAGVSDNDVYEVIIDTADGKKVTEDYYVKDGKTLSKFTIDANTRVGLGNLAEHTEGNPLVIEKGCMYVMGDNRAVSDDSRKDLGQVPLSRLFGVVI